jgi:hypothetical protein
VFGSFQVLEISQRVYFPEPSSVRVVVMLQLIFPGKVIELLEVPNPVDPFRIFTPICSIAFSRVV